MSAGKTPLIHGRASFDRRAWADAFEALACAESESAPLDRDDLERLAWSAALRGCDDAFLGALERLHHACVEAAEPRRAARAAFWIGFRLLGTAASAGWLARATRLLENEESGATAAAQQPCAERGYLLLPMIFGSLGEGELIAAEEHARDAVRIGELCGDIDLIALARSLEAKTILAQNRIGPGLALLDEVMVAVTSGELSTLITGMIYCNSIGYCQEVYALDRAREWTASLTRWCNEQPQLVTFTGLCRVHRAELMQLGGAWSEAIDVVQELVDRSSNADPEVFGDACYQQGELHRLRGDLEAAEKAYRLASEGGREPQPGLALLRLMQGQTDAAVSALRRVLLTTPAAAKANRARYLPAFVDTLLATNAIDEARTAARELDEIARELGGSILGAIAAHARGAVCVAEGDHQAAIEPLRHAFGVWNKAGAPYIAARIRVLLGRAFLALGDADGASLERDAARRVFEELGASCDLAALAARDDAAAVKDAPHGLSQRELEVLRLLAQGKTNKAIAKELFVSERTIDRHVSNIFAKLGVSTRSAATAFAYENTLF